MGLNHITVLIPARNEATVIRSTLERLLEEGLQPPQVHVIADDCQDDTAKIALSLGVRVWERSQPDSVGKGPAISWWLRQTAVSSDTRPIVIVLDADTHIEAGFIKRMVEAFLPAMQIAQARIEPLRSSDSHVATLASYSEMVEQHVFDALRARLGWPVRLRGTGMAFRRSTLEAIAGNLRTSVEDIELTILALRAGCRIQWIQSTCIFDPKPLNTGGAARQRARWLKGQIEILRRYWQDLLRLFIAGPGAMTLVASLLLKPRTLFLPLKCVAALLLTLTGIQAQGGWVWLMLPAGLLWLDVAFEILAFMVGLRYVDDPWRTVRALLWSPLYGLMWLRSAVLALFSREAWLRGRDSGEPR